MAAKDTYALIQSLSLEVEDFNYFQTAIKRLSGIHMSPVKKDLMQGRLRGHIQNMGYASFKDYRHYLETLPDSDPEWEKFINLLTTNKTDFFREAAHFDLLKEQIIPNWLKTNASTFKVWCAASSSGEEPYTIAMVLAATLPKDKDFMIFASDIDTNVLAKAKNGIYPVAKLNEIPESYRTYVQLGDKGIENWMRIHPKIKSKVKFQRFNLISDVYQKQNDFDLIFCRNVLIYFKPDTVEHVLKTLYPAAKEGATLLVSHTESLQSLKCPWKFVSPSVYIKGGGR